MSECDITLEIFEGKGATITGDAFPNHVEEGLSAWMLGDENEPEKRVGDRFQYPDDLGKLCPWLVDSLTGFLRALENGATLSWRYAGSPYEKQNQRRRRDH